MSFAGRLGAIALLALLLPSCTNPGSVGRPSPSLSSAISPDSKAADLRIRLDRLLGEHVMVVAKISLAAAGNRPDEYAGYATLLTTNGDDMKAVLASALGASAAAGFAQIWSSQNSHLVDYAIGQATHNAKKSNSAMAGLLNGFVPQLAQFIASTTQVPRDTVAQLLTKQVQETRAVIDDQVAKSYTKMYTDLRSAYAHSSRLGDLLAMSIALKFPDKFPGIASNKAADLRASLNLLLQEHAYLATMTTGALAGVRNAEQAAAQSALAANAADLSTAMNGLFGDAAATRFDQIWSTKDAELVIYSGSRDAARRQTALSDLTGSFAPQLARFVHDSTGVAESSIATPTQSHVRALIRVVDGQRAGSLGQVAPDDRTAAAVTQPMADLITLATVARMPSKFG